MNPMIRFDLLNFDPSIVASRHRYIENEPREKSPDQIRSLCSKQLRYILPLILLAVGCFHAETGLKESIQHWNDLIEDGKFEQVAIQMFDPKAVEKSIKESGKDHFVQSVKDRRELYTAIFADVSGKEPDLIVSWGIKVANFKFDHEISGYYAVAFKQINGRWVMHSLYRPGQALLQND